MEKQHDDGSSDHQNRLSQTHCHSAHSSSKTFQVNYLTRSIPRSRFYAIFSLAALIALIVLGRANDTSLPPNDSALHALVALDATQAQGFVPRLPMGEFNDHPFPLFYLNGLVMRALGSTPWSARALPGLFAVALALSVAALGTRLRSWPFGFAAAIFLFLSPGALKTAASFHLDIPMLFFIVTSFWLWLRGSWGLAGVFAGLGMWIKTPVALLLVPVSFAWLGIRGELRTRLRGWIGMSACAIAVGFSVWALSGFLGGWDLVWDYWRRQLWGTAIGGRGQVQSPDLFLFFKVLRDREYLPALATLLPALAMIALGKHWRKKEVALPLLASGVLIAAISPLRFKYAHYFLPAFPFIALLQAQLLMPWLKRFEGQEEARFNFGFTGVTLVALAAVVVFPIPFAPEAFPALKRFNPYIQSYGNCEDQVLFVPGSHPYGGIVDYSIEIRYATGRKVQEAPCSELVRLASQPSAGWILMATSEEHCLDAGTRSRFPTALRFGNQRLLTNRIPRETAFADSHGSALDLSPLQRELQGSIDCRAPEIKRDRYYR